ELNCRSGTLTGRLSTGHYSILVDGLLPQNFEGVMSAHYDKRTHTFVNGVCDVMENAAPPPGRLARGVTPGRLRRIRRIRGGSADERERPESQDVSDELLVRAARSRAEQARLQPPPRNANVA